MACLLPQAHKGQFEERTLEAEGSPETQPARLPQGSGGSSHQVRAGLIVPSPRRRRFLKLFCPPKLSAFSPLPGKWRAAVHAHKNKLRLFWSIAGRMGRASARLARFQEVFFVPPGLSTDASGNRWQPALG